MVEQNIRDRPAPVAIPLLQCPGCAGSLRPAEGGGVECSQCGVPVAVADGIIDFVAGAAVTALDEIDYNQFYSINLASSLHLYESIRAAAGAFWPDTLGNAVEIGCGTGGFTTAILSRSPAAHVVLTDVSVKMLCICRERLNQLDNLQARRLTFATYGGDQACLASNAFDTCYGTSVVHHILDVPDFLSQVHTLLRPRGRAFFLEPNARFHHALTATLASILADWMRLEAVPASEITLMLNWTAEVHCNVVNSGDIEILADREDKHQFIAEDFEATARAAGFDFALALPAGHDPTGIGAMRAYLAQCGINDRTFALLEQAWPAAQAAFFGSLSPRDLSPSYLLWMCKGAVEARQAEAVDGQPSLQLWLDLTLTRDDGDLLLTVRGWCSAVARVKSVEFSIGDHHGRLPVWMPRPDVQSAVNKDGIYPSLHALCSGIAGTLRLGPDPGLGEPVAVVARIATVDQGFLPGGRAMLTVDGASDVIAARHVGAVVSGT